MSIINPIQLTPANSATSQNNRLRLQFPYPFDSKNNELALANCFLYYSWRNITSSYGNNTVSYVFNGVTRNITLPDGFYTVSDISGFLQLKMYENGEYTLDSNGVPYYYLELQSNPVYYAVTLTCRPITLPSGGSNPNAITLSGDSPQLVINSSSFGRLIGFTTGSYPSVVQTSTYQVNSNTVAQISPVTSVNINCNMVSNSKFNSLSPNTIYTFSPTVGYTEQITIQPQTLLWYRSLDQTYSFLEIWFTDQDGRDLAILDTNITVTLLVRSLTK